MVFSPESMSSKMWLSKNGLNAKKLTILDALSPTFIPHKPKYVPIINKSVLSKVFDDVSLKFCVKYFSCHCYLLDTSPLEGLTG